MDIRVRTQPLQLVVMCLAVTTLFPACGPDPCDQVEPDYNARRVECGGTPIAPSVDENGFECTEARARIARCQSDCIQIADCEAFLVAGSASLALADCMAACQRMFDGG
jgi:hypothetical protein